MKSGINVSGLIRLELIDKNGILIEERVIKNTITTVGLSYLAAWLAASSQSSVFMPYIGLGSGSNKATTADTALQSEMSTRISGDVTSNGSLLINSATFSEGINTGDIRETGLFSSSSGGIMMARQIITPSVTKLVSDSLKLTWQITFE